jgi:hypothetical protein
VRWWSNPQARAPDEEALSKPCDGVRYLAGLYTLEELGLQMRRQGAQVGMDDVEQWIALSDGGKAWMLHQSKLIALLPSTGAGDVPGPEYAVLDGAEVYYYLRKAS